VNQPTQYNPRILVAAALLALPATGCALTFDATTLGVPVSMASAASQPAVGDTFHVRSTAVYLFWGALEAHQPSLENTLESQLGPGRAVRDLRIHVSHRLSDLFFTVVTAGIVAPVSVTFDGIVAAPSP
jgi:hypothetical protein